MALDFETNRADFIDSVQNRQGSVASATGAKIALNRWDGFLKQKFNKTDEEIIQELEKLQGTPKFYQVLNSYLQFLLKEGVSPRTIHTYFMTLKSYLRFRGLRIYNEDFKQFVKIPKSKRIIEKPMTKDHIKKLLKFASRRMRSFILVSASSGGRKGEVWFLRVSDVDDSVFPVRIRFRAEHTKTREERFGFITPEAYESMKEFMMDKDPEDFIYAKKRITGMEQSVDLMFMRLRKKAGLEERQSDGWHYVVHIHAFRKYTFTQASRKFDSDFGHKLIGHHEYLDTYDQRTIDEIAEKYKEAIPYFTIDESEMLSNKLEDTQRRLEELDETKRRLFDVETKLSRLADKN